MEKHTPLYNIHLRYHGKMVPFAGYSLPVQYANGIIHEHQIVRTKVGLFDVSHMGEFTITGPDALANINRLLTNSYTSMQDGQARYGLMCYPNGTTVDDLLVYRRQENDYLLVVNAANTAKDYAWIKEQLTGKVALVDQSEELAQIAIQGPLAATVISRLTDAIPLKNYRFRDQVMIGQVSCLLSRTGYTGEDGFELYCAAADAETLWETLMNAGADCGIEPCGLGCRDTLRLEAAMPLYGHELSDTITPRESGLDFFIKMDKDFIGRPSLIPAPTRKRIGLILNDRGIARANDRVWLDDQTVGYVTSGTFSPTLNQAIAMALVTVDCPTDAVYTLEVRNRRLKAEAVALPFYKRQKKEVTK